jgi:transcriptional regulator of acetoin/glycerol metabolism
MEPMNIPISQEKLLQLVDWDFSVKQMAKWFGLSHWTILRKLKQFKIS